MRIINNSIESRHFKDGIALLCPVNRQGEPDEEKGLKRWFENRNLSYKRIAEARQVQSDYSRVIAVQLSAPKEYGRIRAVKADGKFYRVEQVEEIFTATPPAAEIALSDWESNVRI